MVENFDGNFKVAFSFADADEWVAKDLYFLLERGGISSYCSVNIPGHANGNLRKKFSSIYNESLLNIMIFSDAYNSKPAGSVVAMERRIIYKRHIDKHEEENLLILNIDNSAPPKDFKNCLIHKVQDIGLIGFEQIISSAMKKLLQVEDEFGYKYSHPPGSCHIRGDMFPCKFEICDEWRVDSKSRWESLGDIKVNMDHELSNGMNVYLIPSSHCIPFLGHSNRLRSDEQCLSIKKAAGTRFIKKFAGKTLDGVVFMMNKDGMDYPTVYCAEYDSYLNRNWLDHN